MINEEQLKKLNQLDRIEYRFRKLELENKETNPNEVLVFFYKVFGFLFVLDIWLFIKGMTMLNIFFYKVISILFIIYFICIIIVIILDYIKKKKLDKEYFKIEVKPKEENK